MIPEIILTCAPPYRRVGQVDRLQPEEIARHLARTCPYVAAR